jgi:thiamine kinase-like enzyme
MTPSLKDAIARVPGWAGRTDLQTTFLSGGITNQNYRVDVGVGARRQSFVLRLGGAHTDLLGIDRRNEYLAARNAATIGVAPEVVAFVEPEGYLVARFIVGREIPPAEMRRAETLWQVAEVLRRVHALPSLPRAFSPFQVVRDYDRLARAYGVTAFPDNYASLRARMDEMESALAQVPGPPVPCHNDLLNGNFLQTADGIRILDWEYAGMGDPFFDLANFAAHHELDDDQVQELLDAYFGASNPARFARLKLLQAMSDFREALWGVLQQGISELDFDFREYAAQFFNRLTARLADARYAQWLRALA